MPPLESFGVFLIQNTTVILKKLNLVSNILISILKENSITSEKNLQPLPVAFLFTFTSSDYHTPNGGGLAPLRNNTVPLHKSVEKYFCTFCTKWYI
jgi:hypothetical protein